MTFPSHSPRVLRKRFKPFGKMSDRYDSLASIAQDIHANNAAQQCTIMMQLGTKPPMVAWEWYMTVPMAKKDFFGGQENALFCPFSEATFLMETLGKRVRYEPSVSSLFRR